MVYFMDNAHLEMEDEQGPGPHFNGNTPILPSKLGIQPMTINSCLVFAVSSTTCMKNLRESKQFLYSTFAY